MTMTTLVEDLERLAAAAPGAPAQGCDRVSVPALVAVAQAARLDFHRVLALLLKHEWEAALAGFAGAQGAREGNVDLGLLRRRFAPDCDALCDILEDADYMPNGFAFDTASLRATVREMVLLDLHRLAFDSAELAAFAARGHKEHVLREPASADVKRAFDSARQQWLLLQEELGERLLYLERCRLDRANTQQRWLAHFGSASIAVGEAAARLANAQRGIELKLARPDLARAEIDRLVAAADAEGRAERLRLRQRLAVATSGLAWPVLGGAVSAEEIADYRRRSKQVLREIWLLIHPDKLAQHAGYGQLTDNQKKLLEDLWHRAMDVRENELGGDPTTLRYDHRSLTVLLDILEAVRGILANAGIDTSTNLIIRGDTLEEQLAWLRQSIERLLQELDAVQAEIVTLLNDPEHQQRVAMLDAAPTKQEEMNDALERRARDLATQADAAEAYVDRLFETAPGPRPDPDPRAQAEEGTGSPREGVAATASAAARERSSAAPDAGTDPDA